MDYRERLEQNQAYIYSLALIVASGTGLLWPVSGSKFQDSISIVLTILMYGMFTQIPFFRIKETFTNKRFIYALLFMNFIVVPALVWLLTRFLPDHPPLLLGVYLVLLTPCIDYVIVFTHLGRGNAKLILVSTPLLFVTQMVVYVNLKVGQRSH